MKNLHFLTVNPLIISRFWLLGIGASLIAIYMTFLWKAQDIAHLGMSAIFGLSVASLLWEKRRSLNLQSEIFPTVLGALLIALVLWQSAAISPEVVLNKRNFNLYSTSFLRLIPLISALGLGLLASGFKGLKQYWQELTILFFLSVPSVVLSLMVDISLLTAKFSAFLLWCSGFQVSLQGVYINLPTGSVKVYSGCSGMESMIYLLGLSVICLILFPIQRRKQIFVPIVAVTVGFIVNGVRVAFLTVLIASLNKQAFDYWHTGEGSLIFGMIAVMIFGFFYLFLLRQEEPEDSDAAEL